MANLFGETPCRRRELLNSASLSPPDLYISLRGVFSSTNPHLQLHTNDTNCQCNYVLICAVCVWVVCVAYIIIRSNQKMQSRLCTLHSRCLVLFLFVCKVIVRNVDNFKFGSRFISAPELDPHLPLLIDSYHLSDTS